MDARKTRFGRGFNAATTPGRESWIGRATSFFSETLALRRFASSSRSRLRYETEAAYRRPAQGREGFHPLVDLPSHHLLNDIDVTIPQTYVR